MDLTQRINTRIDDSHAPLIVALLKYYWKIKYKYLKFKINKYCIRNLNLKK